MCIRDRTTGADGKVWYKAKYNLAANNEECVSYIRSDFVSAGTGTAAVSYTHLDVYKRQLLDIFSDLGIIYAHAAII